jgi:ribosomal protein L15E
MSKSSKKDKPEKPVTFTAGVPGREPREKHKVYKNKNGEIMVDHTQRKGGKWDRINLTNKAGAKNIKQGVKAVKKYHSRKMG